MKTVYPPQTKFAGGIITNWCEYISLKSQRKHMLWVHLGSFSFVMQVSYRQVCVKFKDFSESFKRFPTVFKD